MRHSTIVGIDTHSRKNSVCAIVVETGEMREGTLTENPDELLSWIEREKLPGPVACVYESGPTGFGLARAIAAAGHDCTVAATSKLSYRVDRQKTDRADAEWLARQMLAGGVRAVHVPSPDEESLRHLSRLRGEVAADLRAARQRVASFLLLTGTGYALTKKRWTKRFVEWASSYEFPCPEDTFVFRSKVNAALRLRERLDEVEAEIGRVVASSPDLARRMSRLLCVHGIGKVAAFSLASEVCDFSRFGKGSAFASYLGLVPSENSSGKRVSRGGIAKCGNAHLRRLLVEAASCYSRPSRDVAPEDPSVPEAVRAKAEKCRKRLRRRRRALEERGVPANKAKVAVARELAEWVWWICVMPA